MEKNRGHMTERILNLTLEIIYLLTGEDCSVITNSGERLLAYRRPWISRPPRKSRVSPASRPKCEEIDEEKILEVTQKIIELLTGEVPIRCQDVTVYFSMEEWEYLEGHKDLYKDVMVEDRPPLTSPDSSDFEDKEDLYVWEPVNPSRSNISTPVNHAPHTPTPLNGEPILVEDDTDFDTMAIPASQSQLMPSFVRQEPFPCREELLPHSDLYLDMDDSHYAAIQIKVESESLSDVEEYSATDSLQYSSIHIKEESMSCDEGNVDSMEGYYLEDPPQYAAHHAVANGPTRHKYTPTNSERQISAAMAQDAPPLICSECGEWFSNDSMLVLHQMTHKGKKIYSCPECGMCFSSNTYLTVHLTTHADIKLYACCECGKRFATRQDCAKHENAHTVRKPYVCTECGKVFSNNSNRVRHQKIHTGEKPFSCSVCGKSFRRKTHLTIHSRVHTGEKPFTCLECGKCFSCSAHLTAHRRIHRREAIYLV
ncbi:gastrula zinc finger protein XlCGF66.1-like [Lithobates pipiens]